MPAASTGTTPRRVAIRREHLGEHAVDCVGANVAEARSG